MTYDPPPYAAQAGGLQFACCSPLICGRSFCELEEQVREGVCVTE